MRCLLRKIAGDSFSGGPLIMGNHMYDFWNALDQNIIEVKHWVFLASSFSSEIPPYISRGESGPTKK